MTAAQTSATITLSSPRLLAAVEYLLLHSALAYCTEMIAKDGSLLLVQRWPSLSSGERVLWDSLEILAARDPGFLGAYIPVALNHPDLDVPNRAALATAIGIWEAAS
jgi:hypothetical protein